MRERVYRFGSHGGLVGVLSEPAGGAIPAMPAVLLFNVGLNHHVGPHRLNVDLARHLAARGIVTLRFDLSGQGDSEPRLDGLADLERTALDLREAMDFVAERRGICSFVLVSLCSGVDPAHVVTLTDERVKGSIFIDGYAYPTQSYLNRQASMRLTRLRSPAVWKRWFRHRVLARFGRGGLRETGEAWEIFDRTYPPQEQFVADVDAMRGRGVKLLFLFTSHAYYFDHPSQFAEILGVTRLPHGIDLEWRPEADHVFTAIAERAWLIQRLGDWLHSRFGATVADPARASASMISAGVETWAGPKCASLAEISGP